MERDKRHKRFGDSRYLVEPNIKNGKGGLRDLHNIYWIAKHLYNIKNVDNLSKNNIFTNNEIIRFHRAEIFFWSVRFCLHYINGTAEERLTFDVQDLISQKLKYKNRGGSSRVERFMKHYFLNAKEVADLTRIFFSSIESKVTPKNTFILKGISNFNEKDIDGFVNTDGKINITDKKQFITSYNVCSYHGIEISYH